MDVDGGATMEVDMEDDEQNLRDEQNPYQYNRRRSMSGEDARTRRASIKAILGDETITPHERRRSIQHLMDGRRSSIGASSVASSSGSSTPAPTEDASNPYGYGDANPYGYGDDSGPTPRNNQSSNYADNTFRYQSEQCQPVSNENTKRAEQTRPHCTHYERKCTLISPCCGAAFGCRICHDDSPILPPLLMMKQQTSRRHPRSSSLPGSFTSMETPEDTHHDIDRFAIKEIICRECYTKQSSKT